MDSIQKLDREIEFLRDKLQKIARENEYNFLNEEVKRLSEQLDILIVQRERCKMVKDI